MKLHEIKILEAATGNSPDFLEYDINEGLEILENKCSDGLSRLLKGECFYRSDTTFNKLSKSAIYGVDPSKTERKSQNTSNQYTEIFDNHPEMKDYPKRSRSYIASTSSGRAENFSGSMKVLLPYNGVKIGMINNEDLWDLKIPIFGGSYKPHIINSTFSQLGIKTLEDLKKFSKGLQTGETNIIEKFNNYFDDIDINVKVLKPYRDNFYEEVMKAYSPKVLGLSTGTTANLKWHPNSEVWIGGPCLILSDEIVSDLLEKLGE